MAYTRLIQAPPEAKYLSEFLPNGELPRNCLFDKVLTGCGGTYLALTSPEPYIIAVPTRALVWDKVTSKSYKDFHIAGVSEDFPIGKRNLNLCNKIIVTYKSLPRVAEQLTLSSYNLLIDEAHMLVSMNGYAREELSWILNNFKNFKSYCFMSATIPRKENLLEALKEVDKVRIAWEDVYQTDFRCLLATSIEEAVLSVMLDHMRKKVPGTPYFFYNSVAGICKVIEEWRTHPETKKTTVNVICANTPKNRSKLESIGLQVGCPNTKADFHFVTATAFEDVDFFDPDGVTYVISDKNYTSTKYSIDTTIPQIVGRLRGSKYNASVTVIYNRHALQNAMSPREFADKLDKDELEAKTLVKDYEVSLARYKEQGVGSSSLKALLASILKNPFIIVKGRSFDFEDMIADATYHGRAFPEVEFYPHARIWFQQSYDLFTENHYVMAKPLDDSHPRPLNSKAEEMKAMDEADAKMFQFKIAGLKSICKLYEDNLEECLQKYPEWSDIIHRVGLDVCKTLKYSKSRIRAYDQGLSLQQSEEIERKVKKSFQVGQIYLASDIKKTFDKLGFEKPKGTTLSRWFHIKKTTKNGSVAYKVLAPLDCFELD